MSFYRGVGYTFAGVVLVLVLLALLGATDTIERTIPPDQPGKHVNVDGIPLRVVDTGQGDKAVLLVHGLLGGVEDWETVVPLLTGAARVITVDRPGHGYSGEPAAANTLALNAHVLRQLCQTLGLKDVVVVGHSYGGSIALKLASEGGGPFRGFVLVAPGGYPDFPPTALERIVTLPVIGRGILRLLIPVVTEGYIRDGLAHTLAPDQDKVPAKFIDRRAALWNLSGPLRARAEHIMAMDHELAELAKTYPSIRVPVIILQGDADNVIPLREGAKRLAREIPTAELREIQGAGHYLQYAQPLAVAEAVNQLWRNAPVRNTK